MTDDEYLNTLDALEAGTLPHGSLLPLSEDVHDRLKAADVPERYRMQCESVFGEYWARVVEWNRDKEHDRIIVKAALALADALKDSGKSNYVVLLDDDIWSRAISEDDFNRMLKNNLEWVPLSRAPGITLEQYLRALVDERNEFIASDHESYLFGWLGDVVPPQRESRNLRRFVIRRVRNWVRETGNNKQWQENPPMDKAWRPREQIDPDDKRAPAGNNIITAHLASILLCSCVESKDVTEASRPAR
jgi:hypothetical protein